MRTVGVAPVLVDVLVAGCGGVGDQMGTNQNTGAPSTKTTNVLTPTETTGVDTSAEPAEPQISEYAYVNFSELNGEQKQAFLDALHEGRANFVPNTTYIVGYDESNATIFENKAYVRYDGQYYRVRVESGGALYKTIKYRIRTADPGANLRSFPSEISLRPQRTRSERASGTGR